MSSKKFFLSNKNQIFWMRYTGWPKKNNTENMSNIHNKLNTCISSKCKWQWTVIGQIHFRYLSAVISLNNYLFNILTYSYCIYAKNIISVCIILVSFGIGFFGPPCTFSSSCDHPLLSQIQYATIWKRVSYWWSVSGYDLVQSSNTALNSMIIVNY